MLRVFLALVCCMLFAQAGFKEGKEVFKKKCSSCHGGYISLSKLKENFFIKNNTLLNLRIPTENMLAYAIMDSAKRIGDENDAEMRKIEIEEYLKNHLENPDITQSICDPIIVKYYFQKSPMKGLINEEEASVLADFFMEYKKERLKLEAKQALSVKVNEKALLAQARSSKKKLLVYATSKTCYFCINMEKEILALKRVQGVLNKSFIFVKVDVDSEELPFSLRKSFKGMTPTFFFLSDSKKLLAQYPGAWKEKDFLNILKEHQ